MKNIFKINFICLIVFIFNTNLVAQQETGMTEEQKAWMEYMRPSKIHKMLSKSVGKWKTKTTFWMTPGAEPIISEGTSQNEMIMGGRYLQSKLTGTAWGMPMEGLNLEGFDNASQMFTSIWIDNLGTGTSIAKGKYDEKNNTINYSGSMVDPMTKGEMKFRETINFIDKNLYVLKMYLNYEGKEFQSMEVEFTRIPD